MSLRILASTPWVRDTLNADPMLAMAVEQMARTATIEGSLRLSGKSSGGPWLAIINTVDSGFDGYRGTGRRVTDAIEHALVRAESVA